jgi:hypothetical protein
MTIELFLGIVGTIIALGAAITTIWQSVLTRNHNRLSVRPLLRIDRKYVTGECASIVLTNAGFGPAIINSVRVSVDGMPLRSGSTEEATAPLHKIGLERAKLYVISAGESFSPNESHAVLEMNKIIRQDASAQKLREAFNHISIEIVYESIYKEQFTLQNSRN